MFSLPEITQTASTVFSAFGSFAGSIMLLRLANELITEQLRSKLGSTFHCLFNPLSKDLTLVFDERTGMSRNEVFDAAEIYLRTEISPDCQRLTVSKTPRQKNFVLAIDKGQEVTDLFENFKLKWKHVCIEKENKRPGEKRHYELSFHRKHKQKVMCNYLPHVVKRANEIKQEEKEVKLYSRYIPPNYEDGGGGGGGGGRWGSIKPDYSTTFETLAMEPELKKMIMDDLKRFSNRKEFYKRVGKAWKRGYLLYGPPGTGKSSLIAAMANHLRYDIYDVELSSIHSNNELRSILLSTTNRSMLVIEDIDCSAEIKDRQSDDDTPEGSTTGLTLSGLLNFIDGLWSTCSDERIFVFTTNHKERIDPALLRAGRMDVHINMSYCTVNGFEFLASNYLEIQAKCHSLFGEIEGLIQSTEVTPAEIAGELMKVDNADVALEGVVNFLKRKRIQVNEVKNNETQVSETKNNDEKGEGAIEIEYDKPKKLKTGRRPNKKKKEIGLV